MSNHAVLIVGWDDNYSVDNFCQASKPSNPGAWIVRDSHGDNAENTYTYDEVKKLLFESAKDSFIQNGITSADQITDEFITNFANKAGYTIVNGKIFVQHNDDGYKYYYYLSPNQTENSTKLWTEIKNAKTDNNKLEFEINTSDIKNYSEIIKGNSLYLYIKEIATKGTKETSLETNAIKVESTVKAETYVDNVKKDDNRNEQNNNENNNQNNNENNTSKEENNIQQIQTNLVDTTKSSNILPHTGFKSILIIIGIIALIGTLAYFKYKKLSKYIK